MANSETTGEAAANLVCRQCGLCCTGLLFARVSLKDGDGAARRHMGLAETAPGKISLDHPCRFLDQTRCAIYEDRPTNCRTYECQTRRDVLNGAADCATGLKRVAEVRERLAALDPLALRVTGKPVTGTGFRAFCYGFLKGFRKKQARGLSADVGERALIKETFALLKIIDRHFRANSRLRIFAGLVFDLAREGRKDRPDK